MKIQTLLAFVALTGCTTPVALDSLDMYSYGQTSPDTPACEPRIVLGGMATFAPDHVACDKQRDEVATQREQQRKQERIAAKAEEDRQQAERHRKHQESMAAL